MADQSFEQPAWLETNVVWLLQQPLGSMRLSR
jgi:hypothetical protein